MDLAYRTPHDGDINVSISRLWDKGIDAKLGDEMNNSSRKRRSSRSPMSSRGFRRPFRNRILGPSATSIG